MTLEDKLKQYTGELGSDAKVGNVSLVPRVRRIDRRQLSVLVQPSHHAVLAVWDSELPDERALVFLGPEEEAAKQRIRADLIHQLFPRAILLTERHRWARFCDGLDFSELSVEVGRSRTDYISWRGRRKRVKLVLSEECWENLLPSGFLSRFRTTVENLIGMVGPNERKARGKWHHVVDAGRTLREEFANRLLLCRRETGDRAAQSGRGKARLLRAIGFMASKKQLRDRRFREYQDEQHDLKRLLEREDVTLFVDAETINDFLCLLQGLRCYMGNNRCLRSWLRRVHASEHQAISILALGAHAPTENSCQLDEPYLSGLYQRYVELAHEHDHYPANGAGDATGERVLPELIQKKLETWVRGTSLNEVCASRLVALAKVLAEKHSVHEQRQLHYRFAYAQSASLWQEIEEVLSFEASLDDAGEHGPHNADRAVGQQARFIEAHWSIFQPERVFGVVDTLMKDSTHWPRIQRVVRVRPPVAWSGLESEAMDGLAAPGAPVVSVLKQWIVRLSWSKDGKVTDSLVWDVRTEKWDEVPPSKERAKDIALAVGAEDNDRVCRMLTHVISEVSEAPGEGALLVAVGNKTSYEIVKRTCVEMDTYRMAWRSDKQLRWLDRTLLRAMLILDGATVLQKGRADAVKVRPRVVVYPFSIGCPVHGATALSVMNDRPTNCTCLPLSSEEITAIQNKLVGKGSRKHGAANIAVLLRAGADRKSCVVSISADGPIDKWPLEPKEEEGVRKAIAEKTNDNGK